jgi:hypothetical protein
MTSLNDFLIKEACKKELIEGVSSGKITLREAKEYIREIEFSKDEINEINEALGDWFKRQGLAAKRAFTSSPEERAKLSQEMAGTYKSAAEKERVGASEKISRLNMNIEKQKQDLIKKSGLPLIDNPEAKPGEFPYKLQPGKEEVYGKKFKIVSDQWAALNDKIATAEKTASTEMQDFKKAGEEKQEKLLSKEQVLSFNQKMKPVVTSFQRNLEKITKLPPVEAYKSLQNLKSDPGWTALKKAIESGPGKVKIQKVE